MNICVLSNFMKEVYDMKRMLWGELLVLLFSTMVFAQENIEAPIWNIGDKWFFTLGNIEVAAADPKTFTLNFSDDACKFQKQSFKAIIFEKTTLNRIGGIEGGQQKKYKLGLRRMFDFPLNMGKQWKDEYSGRRLVGVHPDLFESYTETFTVLGWEDLEVRAGKFRAIKLEYKHVITASTMRFASVPFEMKSIFWYSPAAKYFIKSQYDKSIADEVKDWELTSLKGKK